MLLDCDSVFPIVLWLQKRAGWNNFNLLILKTFNAVFGVFKSIVSKVLIDSRSWIDFFVYFVFDELYLQDVGIVNGFESYLISGMIACWTWFIRFWILIVLSNIFWFFRDLLFKILKLIFNNCEY